MASFTEDDGLQVVLTPIQLAALLQGSSIARSATLSNRFWGALGVIGGAVDMVASVPFWLAPEPLSKVAAGAIDYVGADLASTGLRQVWTGQLQVTLTADAVDHSLTSLGIDPTVAEKLSNSTELAMNVAALVAVPLSVASLGRAARVTSIERGLIDLEIEETFPGAHTIREHVGRSADELRSRLSANPRLTRASSFRTLEEAERGVTDVIAAHRFEIQEWAASAREGAKKAFRLSDTSIRGLSVTNDGVVSEVADVQVVLKKLIAEDRVYYVLTAYPI